MTDKGIQAEKSDIRKLIVKLKPLKLPFEYQTPGNVDYSNLYKPDKNNGSLFFPGYVHLFGYLPDTLNYFGLVYLYPSDEVISKINIYEKTGKLLSENNLYVGTTRCGPACGIEKCFSKATIGKNLELSFVEKIYYLECDSLDDEIPGTESILTNIQNGKILKNGKIVLEEENITHKKLNN